MDEPGGGSNPGDAVTIGSGRADASKVSAVPTTKPVLATTFSKNSRRNVDAMFSPRIVPELPSHERRIANIP